MIVFFNNQKIPMYPQKQISKKKISLALLIVCIICVLLWSRRSSSSLNSQAAPLEPSPASAVVSPPAPQSVEPVSQATSPQEMTEPAPAKQSAAKKKIPSQTTSAQPNQSPKEPLRDPDARDALALVGVDPQAEQYWLDAIFDSNLPDKEREDLMEDLNEVGFADPHNVTTDDLPLIVSRLHLIEQIEPQADPFMRDHLAEAYKDLGNMYSKVAGE